MEGEESSQSQMDEASVSNKRTKPDSWESDRLLNFTTAADEFELSLKRQKIPRDPMSHRIIEKRRRDRMNNCLADLSRLIPASYHKQGQGRIEKTEIIEMAIKHINMLQGRVDELEKKVATSEKDQCQTVPPPPPPQPQPTECPANRFYLGFREAQDEVMRFLVEVESVNTMDPFCKKIMSHLENASHKFLKDAKLELPPMETECSSHQTAGILSHPSFYSSPPTMPHTEEGPLGTMTDPKRGVGTMPMFSYSSQISGMGSSIVGSSGYISDTSNLEKNSPNGSTSSRDNVYKFKHNITKRFSQEGHHHHRYGHHHHHMQHHQPSDTSSNTSSRDLEDDQGQIRWKAKRKGSIYRDDLGTDKVSPNSDDFNSGSNSNDASRSHWSSTKGDSNLRTSLEGLTGGVSSISSSSSSQGSSVALPGFILHPSGTHYMPISVHNTNISKLFDSGAEQDGMPVFHPISIPVHFRRPVISMPDITICTHAQQKDRNAGGGGLGLREQP